MGSRIMTRAPPRSRDPVGTQLDNMFAPVEQDHPKTIATSIDPNLRSPTRNQTRETVSPVIQSKTHDQSRYPEDNDHPTMDKGLDSGVEEDPGLGPLNLKDST